MSLRAAAAGLKWASIAKVVCQCVTWVITLVVIRLLDPADYGATAVAAVFVSVLATVAELGLGASLIRAHELDEGEVGRIAAASIALNLACTIVIVAASPLLGWLYQDPRIGTIAATSALTLLLAALATVPESLLYREMNFKRLAVVDVASTVVGSVATLLLALGGMGVWSLVLGPLSGSLARAVLVIALSRWIRPIFSLRGLAGHLRFGGALTAGRLAWQASQQCDVLIGGRFLSESALGLYAVSVHLARMPLNKVMSVINQVALPAVARLQSDRAALASHTLHAIWLLSFLTVPILWGLSSVAPELVIVVLGDQWIDASMPLQVAALAMPLQLFANVMSTVLAGLGRADVELRNMLTTLGLTVVAVLIGSQFGVIGLTVGWSVAAVGALAVNMPRTNRVIGLALPAIAGAVRAPLFAGLCMYAGVTALRHLLDDLGNTLRLGALVAVGAAIYVVVVSVLSPGIWTLARRALTTVRTA
jgi:teichuronic acid exporter